MDKDEILFYLQQLSDALAKRGVTGEIVLYDGAVMVLVFHARIATKDVDAVFAPKSIIREAAEEVQELHGAPEGWLNDAVKGFASERGDVEPFLDLENLRVLSASPYYLLAMKCLSARLGEEAYDLDETSGFWSSTWASAAPRSF